MEASAKEEEQAEEQAEKRRRAKEQAKQCSQADSELSVGDQLAEDLCMRICNVHEGVMDW